MGDAQRHVHASVDMAPGRTPKAACKRAEFVDNGGVGPRVVDTADEESWRVYAKRRSPAGGPGGGGILADRVLDGHGLGEDEALAVLRVGDHELLDLLAAAYRVRYRWFGNRMHLNLLVNAKSGMCGEDCAYCSQSRASTAAIPKHPLLTPEQLLDGARLAAERKARTYCIVTSGRGPTAADLDALAGSCRRSRSSTA